MIAFQPENPAFQDPSELKILQDKSSMKAAFESVELAELIRTRESNEGYSETEFGALDIPYNKRRTELEGIIYENTPTETLLQIAQELKLHGPLNYEQVKQDNMSFEEFMLISNMLQVKFNLIEQTINSRSKEALNNTDWSDLNVFFDARAKPNDDFETRIAKIRTQLIKRKQADIKIQKFNEIQWLESQLRALFEAQL
jgi:hypothetical protein